MKRIIFLALLSVLLVPATVKGQIEIRQAGFRMGYRGGIFYQVSHEAGNAEIGYNAMLSFNNRGIQVTGLKIIYETSLNEISPNLFFAWGYGGHAGFIYSDHVRFMGENYYFHGERFSPVAGVDGWLAAEYRISSVPVNVSLNLKPFVELTFPSFMRIIPGDFAVSVSYVF